MLVGRETELARILAVRSGTVLVTGVPGIGKTALVKAVAARTGAVVVEDATAEDLGGPGLVLATSRTDELRHLADLHVALGPLPESAMRQLVPDEQRVRRARGHALCALDVDDLRRRMRGLPGGSLLVAVDVLGLYASNAVLAEVLGISAGEVKKLKERQRVLLRMPWLAEFVDAPLVRARALRWAGRPEDAAAELRAALAVAEVSERCALLHLLWDCQFVMGDRAAAFETLKEAKALAVGGMVGKVAVAEASWLMSQGEYGAAIGIVDGLGAVDLATRAYSLSVRGVCEAFLGDVEGGAATLEAARDLAHRSGSIRELARAVGNLTYVLGSAGEHERSARIGREALRRLEVQGLAPALSAPVRYNLATSLLALGRWEELQGLAVPDTIPGNKAARILLCKAEAKALQGEDPADLIADAEKVIDGPDALFEAQCAYTRAVACRAAGQFRAAVELCRRTVEVAPEALTAGEVLRLCAEGLGAARDLRNAGGRVTKLDDPEATERELLARLPEPVGAEDLVWLRVARAEAGLDCWSEIAESWDRLKMPYQAAYARTRSAGAEALRKAHDSAERLGARPLVKMIGRAARRQRVPLLHQDKPQLGTLTPRESEVLELLGWGRTNKEIAEELVLSVRTVGLHVSHVLAKLGAGNRAEAARIARDQT